MRSPPPVAQVENLDQYLLQEGETEDEYKRIYELRYSIVLVPFASEADKEKAKQEKEIRARRSQSRSVEPEESQPTSSSSTGQRLFPTPTSMPREKPAGRWSARQMTLTGGSSSRTPTPLERTSRHNSAVSSLEHTFATDHDDEDDHDEASHTQLMPSDPLSNYLPKTRVKNEDAGVSKRRRSDASTELDDWESFHDALDHPEDITHDRGVLESSPSTASGLQGPSSSTSSSASSGTKRQHWELSPFNRLMQPREPNTPSKRFAPAPKAPVAPRPIITTSLMKPRSFTPRLSFPALPAIPLTLQRRNSILSDASFATTCSSSSTLWTKSNWKDPEGLYKQMNGTLMDEAGLAEIARRFLDEQESRTGERPPWTRETVLTRCIALHRVRHGKNNSNSRAPHRHLQASRHSAAPYPVRNGHGSFTRASSASSSGMTDFVNQQRIERNQRQRDLGQGYQLKSIFKHRLASGLRTVGQLLPFWKDVEKGNTDEKEKVVVPLVPAGRAQSVIEAFESQSEDLGWTGSNYSRAESVVSSRCSDHEGLGATSSRSSVVSVADLIARGHSSRAASALTEE
ncbi:hypothetical protein BGZ70_010478 [Mortierella alpina]|uniref:Acylphosphatase-like domain-containing protein n=1 Tax=Mortierella alpina TaxID=64518 RepID=A0A9P6LZL5_MORAP|nr:hypothetical protein BGZ70_010478 [Mortierella alpina]